MALELPPQLSVQLTIKVDQPYSNTRAVYGRPIALTLVVEERYGVFRAKVKERVSAMEEIVWDDDGPILWHPTANARQENYESLASQHDDFRAQLLRMWKSAGKRKSGQTAFELQLFIYVQKLETRGGLRRATEAHVVAAAVAINDHLDAHDVQGEYGATTRRYWAVSHVRQPDGTPGVPPTGNTFVQLQHIDTMQAAIDAADQDRSQDPEFVSITCRLNGGLIPIETRIGELRSVFGLPQHSLYVPFRQPTPQAVPFANMADVDHRGDDDEME